MANSAQIVQAINKIEKKISESLANIVAQESAKKNDDKAQEDANKLSAIFATFKSRISNEFDEMIDAVYSLKKRVDLTDDLINMKQMGIHRQPSHEMLVASRMDFDEE